MPRFGLLKTTLIEYPGEVAAALFTHGCNLRCPYCHNPELVSGCEPPDFLGEDEILAFLMRRRRVLGGLVIGGGEPLLEPGLGAFLERARALGYLVKIDTNGTRPEVLSELDADFVSLDLKTVPDKYERLLGAPPGTGERIMASIEIVKSRFPRHELRTTVAPGIVEEEDVPILAELARGAHRYVLAQYRAGKTLDPGFTAAPYTTSVLEAWRDKIKSRGTDCMLRLSDRSI